jgi:hypothetical protein
MGRQTQSGRELLTHFAAGLHLSSHFHILSYNTILPHHPLNLRDMLSPQKLRDMVSPQKSLPISLWEVIRLPFCLPEQA